jgi:hypothetical protein
MPRKKGRAASNASATASKSGNAKPERGAKTAAIKDLYARGMTNASEIDQAIKAQGLSVSKPVIYQTIKKLKGGDGKKAGKRKGRKPGKVAAATTAVTPAARKTTSTGLVAADIHELLAITEKAGGVDVVVGLLQNMKRAQ